MIYHLHGKLSGKEEGFLVIDVGGVGYKVYSPKRFLAKLPPIGPEISLYCHLHVREDALDLFGFASPQELRFFELLTSVASVGPKSALAIFDVAELPELTAAIEENRPDLLTRASGIGRKTAERIVLELKTKVSTVDSSGTVRKMEADADIVETLASLGYRREEIRAVLEKIGKEVVGMEPRLKAALKELSGKG